MSKLEKQILGAAPFLASSQSPEEISLLIKGIALGLIPLAVIILKASGVEAGEELLQELVNVAFLVAGSVMALIGVIRKFKK